MNDHEHNWQLLWERPNENFNSDGKWILVTLRRWYCTKCRKIETTTDPQEGIVG